MTAIQMLLYPEPYDPGFVVVKQFSNTKTTSAQGSVWSDDSTDLYTVLQPGFLYRVFMVLRFKQTNTAQTPGVMYRLKYDANATYFGLDSRGSSFGTDAAGSLAMSYGGMGLQFTDGVAAGAGTAIAGTVLLNGVSTQILNGHIAIRNAPVVLTPEWRHNVQSGANGAIQFMAGSWMWVRKEQAA